MIRSHLLKRIASTDLVSFQVGVTRRCHSFNYASHPSNKPLFPLSRNTQYHPIHIQFETKKIKKKKKAMNSCQRQTTTNVSHYEVTLSRGRKGKREMGEISKETKIVAKVVTHSKDSPRGKDFALSMTAFLMKIVGLWLAKNKQEQRKRHLTLMYTVIAILFGVWVQFRDFYYSWPNFGVSNIF